MDSLCIIPARGGSKRIPRKNIKSFCGKPIIAYSIELAIGSKLFDEVIVSTDDERIAEISREYGANIPFMRPKDIADDFATTRQVINHAIEWYARHRNQPDYCCCLYATSPLIERRVFIEGYERIKNKKYHFVFPVTEFTYPIQRALIRNEDGGMEMLHPENRNTRSQDMIKCYHDAGQFYWGKAQSFLDDIPTFSENSYGLILSPWKVQDIDTIDDWIIAEMIYKQMNKST